MPASPADDQRLLARTRREVVERHLWLVACVESEAVTVAATAVLRVTLKLRLPLTRDALAGRAALASLEVIATVSLVLTTFQLASTPLTVTLKAVPAV